MAGGDRGHIAVNVPSPVVPYVPNNIQQTGLGANMVSDGSIWQNFQKTSRLGAINSKSQNSLNGIQKIYLSKLSDKLSNDQINDAKPQHVPPRATQTASAADFSSFHEPNQTPKLKVEGDDYSIDEGYHETDRIDVPSLIEPYSAGRTPDRRPSSKMSSKVDPNALIYSQKSAPYGEQFPSYVPHSIETVMGSTLNTQKRLAAGNNIVYGRGKVHKSKPIKEQVEVTNPVFTGEPRKINNVLAGSGLMGKDNEEYDYEDTDYDDYSEYDDDYEGDFENSGEYYDLESDTYLEQLNNKLRLVDDILNESTADLVSEDGKTNLLPDLVKMWQQTSKE